MLEKLLNCNTVEDLITVGVWLIDSSRMATLRSEIAAKNCVFDVGDYWASDTLEFYTVQELLKKCREEEEMQNILHTLQLLQRCCPAVSMSVSKLLQKMTR